MDPRTNLAPDPGLLAWLKGRSRLRRARALYAAGQVIASRSQPASSARSARLYRRGLELLGVPVAHVAQPLDRVTTRDQLRAELGRRGLRGWLRARPRQAFGVASVGALALLASAVISFLEPDLAEGKPWQASSVWGSFPGVGVMVGEAPLDGRFHTNEEQDPWVRLDLGSVMRVHAVRIENRTNCCKERAIPLAVELSVDGQNWKVVGYRRLLFDTFTQHFSPREARYLRLRVDRRSVLHLRRISVY